MAERVDEKKRKTQLRVQQRCVWLSTLKTFTGTAAKGFKSLCTWFVSTNGDDDQTTRTITLF